MQFSIVFIYCFMLIQISHALCSEPCALDVEISSVALLNPVLEDETHHDHSPEYIRYRDMIEEYEKHCKERNFFSASKLLIDYKTSRDDLQIKADKDLYDYIVIFLKDDMVLTNPQEIINKLLDSPNKDIVKSINEYLATDQATKYFARHKRITTVKGLMELCFKRKEMGKVTKILMAYRKNHPEDLPFPDSSLLKISNFYKNMGNRAKEKDILDVLIDSPDQRIGAQAIMSLIGFTASTFTEDYIPSSGNMNDTFDKLVKYYTRALEFKDIAGEPLDLLNVTLSESCFFYGAQCLSVNREKAQDIFEQGQGYLNEVQPPHAGSKKVSNLQFKYFVAFEQWGKILSHQEDGQVQEILEKCAEIWQSALNHYDATIKKMDGTEAEFKKLQDDAVYLITQYLDAHFYNEADKVKKACLNHPVLRKKNDFIAPLQEIKTLELLDGKSRSEKRSVQKVEEAHFKRIMEICTQQRATQKREKAQALKDEKTQAAQSAKAAKCAKRKRKAVEKKAKKALERETKKEQPEHNQDKSNQDTSEQVKTPSRLQKAREALENVSKKVHIVAEVLRNPAQAVQRHALPQVLQSYQQVKIKEPTRQERIAQHAANPKQKLEERVSRKPMNSVQRTRLEIEEERAKKTVKKEVLPIFLRAEKRDKWEQARYWAEALTQRTVIKFSEMQGFLKMLKRLGLLSEKSTPGKMIVGNVLISGHPDHNKSIFDRAYAKRIIKEVLRARIKFREPVQ